MSRPMSKLGSFWHWFWHVLIWPLFVILAISSGRFWQNSTPKFWKMAKIPSTGKNNDYFHTLVPHFCSASCSVKFCKTFTSTDALFCIRICIGLWNSENPKTCKTKTTDTKFVLHCLSPQGRIKEFGGPGSKKFWGFGLKKIWGP